jgi:excisionase family DNA binding protein
MLTIRQVAGLARVSVSTVERAVRRGELRAFKLGRATRIAAADARSWLTATPVQVQVRDTAAGAA